jgi:uncharacterized sporulation protein YeaH/YhbH (DUF444 family)
MKQKNKWTLEMDDYYRCGDQTIIKTDRIAIPPTNGDRTDLIIEFGGKREYKYGMTKEQFMQRISKEEYLEQCLPGLEGKEKDKVLKEIDWTPRRYEGQIALIIEIKNGNLTIKGK